ncbi:MAG: tetratricopeptide repeat protein [Planctomycetes bacterium]|nr:tetratricopeptide repeat protein [Planctomycetota bacterium]
MGAKGRRSKKSSSHSKKDKRRRRAVRHSQAKKTIISRISRSGKRRKDIDEVSRKPISGRRLSLFRIVALTIIPALLFLLMEITLRVVGYGFPTNIIIKQKVNNIPSYCNNLKFAWRFFHPNIARTTDPFVFPVSKSKDTYRIFVMGASAAAGTPDGAFSFGRILQVMLRQQYPDTNFEVIIPAMPAINSHVVLEIADDCKRYQSDLFIIYLGNNEVVGPYGAGTVFSPLSSNLSLIRFGIALKATKLGQLITNLLESPGSTNVPKVWRGLEMFLEKQVRADNTKLGIVYRHFQRNLQDIRHLACKSGINIIFSTVPSNLKDCPPFASLHRPDLINAEKKNFDELYQQGVKYEADGDYDQAVEWFLKAAEIDSYYANLQFRMGRCYWAMGKYEKSRERYIQARELDTLRFRADNQINEIIRNIACNRSDEGVYMLDAVRRFDENSPHEIPGEELFLEHVHMNFKGNYLLAKAVFEQTEKILPEWIKLKKEEERSFPTEEECARLLAYTDWDLYKIYSIILNDYFKQAPFTNQLYNDRRISQIGQELKALEDSLSPKVLNEVEGQYRWAIQQTPSDSWLHLKFAELLEDLGNHNAAANQYRLVLDYMPNHFVAYAKLGLLFGKAGDLDTAIAHNLEAVRIYPVFAEAYFNLGFAYQLQKKYDQSVKHYSQAILLVPDNAITYNNLGSVLYQQGKVDEAIETYRNGLKIIPDNLDLHYNLGIVLEEQGHREEALRELRTALKIEPNSTKVRKILNIVLKNAAQ